MTKLKMSLRVNTVTVGAIMMPLIIQMKLKKKTTTWMKTSSMPKAFWTTKKTKINTSGFGRFFLL